MPDSSSRARWAAIYTDTPLHDVSARFDDMGRSHYRMRYLSTLLECCPRGGTALETGIGTGFDSVWLSKRGVIAAGIDNVEVIVERANQAANALNCSARFRVADMFSLYHQGIPRVDLIHNQGVLEHYSLRVALRLLVDFVRMANR